jgi:hypothetical protein
MLEILVKSPKKVGEISESIFLGTLLQQGKTVLIPFGDSNRYDLVIEDENVFKRIQVKTGKLKNGSIVFNTCSLDVLSQKRKSYRGQIDFFGVYVPELNKCYLVPVNDVPEIAGYLRVDRTKNGQRKNIKWAKEYEI